VVKRCIIADLMCHREEVKTRARQGWTSIQRGSLVAQTILKQWKFRS